jgi:hypothetical protein
MTRDEVLDRLRSTRAAFDERVAAIPARAFTAPVPGGTRSPAEIVRHLTAYDDLVVERLRAARGGETTAFDRDRTGWEAFNERIWAEAVGAGADDVIARSGEVSAALLDEVAALTDAELNEAVGITAVIDPAWLDGHPLWELIGVDVFDHYPMHFAALEAAARG